MPENTDRLSVEELVTKVQSGKAYGSEWDIDHDALSDLAALASEAEQLREQNDGLYAAFHSTQKERNASEARAERAETALREIADYPVGDDGFQDIARAALAGSAEAETEQELPCPHARPSWRMCPHCLGINRGPASTETETT